MADVIITYDLPSHHSVVKNSMKQLGYRDTLAGGSGTVYLPNTTLWKPNATPKEAIDNLLGICDQLHVSAERAIAAPLDNWYAIHGKPL
jgi:hypothetical protein